MKWIQKEKAQLSAFLVSNFGKFAILDQELARRNLSASEECLGFLNPGVYQQTSPYAFLDMAKVVSRILQAIDEKEIIGIWGDFDVDGQTSTAVLVDGLTKLGARTTYHIPIRARESHGVNLSGFKAFVAERQPKLVITCDTGISDHESIEYANVNNIDVIITDHHKIPTNLPEAYAIVNPHQLPASHPLAYLAGVGSAFQVIRALALARPGCIDQTDYYDLVALGTVADIAQQKSENRFYTQMGLSQMNSRLRPAIQAILQISHTKTHKITENTIGFTIAPRLNAAGRLGDANPNVDYLLSEDTAFCANIAKHLENLNADRKMSVESVFSSAQEIITKTPHLRNQSIIVLSHAKWEGGVLGIAAGKLAGTYNRPVILLREKDNQLSGSARSITGIDITEAIGNQSDLLISFGGHAMAAGLQLPKENLPGFIRRMILHIDQLVGPEPEKPAIQISHFISFSEITQQLSRELRQLAPFGPGNPAPVFASRNLEILQARSFGNQNQHLKYKFIDVNGDEEKMVCWNVSDSSRKYDRVNVAYKVQPDEYRGGNNVFLEFVDLQEFSQNEKTIDAISHQISFEDYRNLHEPIQTLRKLTEKFSDLQVWYEGTRKPEHIEVAFNRNNLANTDHLVILTAPPDFTIMNQVIQSSKANKVFLFNYRPNHDMVKKVLEEIGGVIKFLLAKEETIINLDEIAAQINQTDQTVHLGLRWFQANGNIMIAEMGDGQWVISSTKSAPNNDKREIEQKLTKSLKETIAFRNYYHRVEPEFLLRKYKGEN